MKHAGLEFRRAAPVPRGSDSEPAGWHWLALVLTLLVHAGFWQLLDSAPRKPAGPGDALEVVFIESIEAAMPTPVPPMPVPPARSRPAVARTSGPLMAPELPPTPDPVVVPDDPGNAPATDLRLFDDGARPLLPADGPVAAAGFTALPSTMRADARRFGNAAELPGSDQRIVDVGDLRDGLSAQQVVLGLAQFLFGAPRPDSCDKVEARLLEHAQAALLNRSDPVVRAIDLDTFAKRCRGRR